MSVEELGAVATATFSLSDSPDIGEVLVYCRSCEEFSRKMLSLSSSDKFSLLKHHSRPPHQFAFSITYLGDCNHAFCHNWFDDHPWIAYSTEVDGAFCVPCTFVQ